MADLGKTVYGRVQMDLKDTRTNPTKTCQKIFLRHTEVAPYISSLSV